MKKNTLQHRRPRTAWRPPVGAFALYGPPTIIERIAKKSVASFAHTIISRAHQCDDPFPSRTANSVRMAGNFHLHPHLSSPLLFRNRAEYNRQGCGWQRFAPFPDFQWLSELRFTRECFARSQWCRYHNRVVGYHYRLLWNWPEMPLCFRRVCHRPGCQICRKPCAVPAEQHSSSPISPACPFAAFCRTCIIGTERQSRILVQWPRKCRPLRLLARRSFQPIFATWLNSSAAQNVPAA